MHLLLFNLATDADDPILGFTTAWLRALAEHCDRVHVITVRQGRLDLPDNVSVHSVGKERGYGKPRKAVAFYRQLGHILRAESIDACFAHMNPIFAVMAAPLLKVRRIPITLWYAHKSVTWTLRVAEKLVDRVVTASPESFRIPSRKVIVTGHGIDTTRFVPTPVPRGPDRPFTVTSVGRLSPVKRLETLVEATDLLVHHRGLTNVRVRLVGPAPDVVYAERLRREVAARGLDEIVDFVGPVPHAHVLAEYQQADVFVNLSDTGSVDKAVLEAMSCRVPVITSNVAFKRILGNLSPSLMVAKQDTLGLADRLLRLSQQSPDEWRALGHLLRRIVVEKHGLDKLVHRLVFELLTGNARSHGQVKQG